MKTQNFNHSAFFILTECLILALAASCSRKTLIDKELATRHVRSGSSDYLSLEQASNSVSELQQTLEGATTQDYQIEIYPTDSFSITHPGNYQGRASKILIRGRNEGSLRMNTSGMALRSEQASAEVGSNESSEELVKIKDISKERYGRGSWYWLLIIPAGIILFILDKKLRRKGN